MCCKHRRYVMETMGGQCPGGAGEQVCRPDPALKKESPCVCLGQLIQESKFLGGEQLALLPFLHLQVETVTGGQVCKPDRPSQGDSVCQVPAAITRHLLPHTASLLVRLVLRTPQTYACGDQVNRSRQESFGAEVANIPRLKTWSTSPVRSQNVCRTFTPACLDHCIETPAPFSGADSYGRSRSRPAREERENSHS